MPRPLGSKNIEIPDPPFVIPLGEHAKMVLTPYQKTTKKDEPFEWAFKVSFDNALDDEMDLEALHEFEACAHMALRWVTRVEREKERLEQQLQALKDKLEFLRR